MHKISCKLDDYAGLTFLKIVCFANIDKNESHQLELGQSLSGGGWDGKKVPQLVDLMIDAVSPHFTRTLRGLGARVITEMRENEVRHLG